MYVQGSDNPERTTAAQQTERHREKEKNTQSEKFLRGSWGAVHYTTKKITSNKKKKAKQQVVNWKWGWGCETSAPCDVDDQPYPPPPSTPVSLFTRSIRVYSSSSRCASGTFPSWNDLMTIGLAIVSSSFNFFSYSSRVSLPCPSIQVVNV